MIERVSGLLRASHLTPRDLLPTPEAVRDGIKTILMVIGGGLLLSPLVGRLPMLGWDWLNVWYGFDPRMNYLTVPNDYPPFAIALFKLLNWMDWRQSLGILNATSLMAFAIATWKNGGRYGSIILALLTAQVFFFLWAGQVDAAALLGLISGFVPLIFVKPFIVGWGALRSKKLIVWSMLFLLVSMIVWPLWPLDSLRALQLHSGLGLKNVTNASWLVTGWPVLAVGLLMLIGAGNDTYRLLSAGMLISPYVNPYHLALLTPALGQARGYRQIAIWLSSWLIVVGIGLGGEGKLLYFAFPLTIYWLTQSFDDYKANVRRVIATARQIVETLFSPPPPAANS